ncbi:MAG: hypothetical protein LH649_03935, partial [Pseudanabaena sp. CAN_BIN31]|nr:hypothetical protein [Pseudanabaena sp. CAN_BIN31]
MNKCRDAFPVLAKQGGVKNGRGIRFEDNLDFGCTISAWQRDAPHSGFTQIKHKRKLFMRGEDCTA